MVIQERNPLTDFAVYLILLLIPSLIVLLIEFLRTKNVKLFSTIHNIQIALEKFIKHNIYFPSLLILLIVSWIINLTQPMLRSGLAVMVQDGFHYGEQIGLSLTFLNNPKEFFNQAYLMVNGFTLNVLPGAIGNLLGGNNYDISFSLIIFYILSITPIFVSFFVLFELAAYISIANKWQVFCLLLFIYLPLYNSIFMFLDRDGVFLIQTYISVRLLRILTIANTEESDSWKVKYVYPSLIGISIPISLLYTYDRATYFALLFCYLLLVIATTKQKQLFIKIALSSLLSIGVTSLFLMITLGINSLLVPISHILYWSKYSGLFTSLPYPQINLFQSEILVWLPILFQSLFISLLLIKFQSECIIQKKNWRIFLSEVSAPLFIFLCAVMYMRIALGRSDTGHLMSPGFFAIFALVILIGKQLATIQSIKFSWLSTLVTCLIVSSILNSASVNAAINISSILEYPKLVNSLLTKRNSDLVTPQYLDTVEKMQDELTGQSCFYTLTSEGIWYRLFRLSPCSKYWYLIYSTSTASQQELINDLRQTAPKIILYSNQSLGNGIDGVRKETSHLPVHQFVWANYRPYKYIHDHWFWIRRETEASVANLLVPDHRQISGSFDTLIPGEHSDVIATGWAFSPANQIPHENAVFLTYSLANKPNDIQLLSIGSTGIERPDVVAATNNRDALNSGWSITFNRLNLPTGQLVNVRAWAYNATDQKLYEIPTPSLKTIEGK
ncbi:hypothetical protein [Chroococcidiopsis sp. TS-821]|uniref:hypothetical protein n=1 Tax=Chroococcidiopsis sp. TS-821 TaxID=1378066 RepID=UPI001AEF8DE0|nr:hypothetical protein [Chroococcidiopsis sp. TS-821]